MKVRVAELESTLDSLKRTLQREHGRADPLLSPSQSQTQSLHEHQHIPPHPNNTNTNPNTNINPQKINHDLDGIASESQSHSLASTGSSAPVAQMVSGESMLEWDEMRDPIALVDAAVAPVRRMRSSMSIVDEPATEMSLASMHQPRTSLQSSPFDLNSPTNFDFFDSKSPLG